MNLQELANETLVEKNRRLLRAKCPHMEIYESTVYGPHGIFANAFCLECGQAIPPAMPRK
jgi:hypothetical protein